MSDHEQDDPAFPELMQFLLDSRSVDFASYKRTSLQRLVARRMRDAGSPDLRSYLDQLQVDPAEVTRLFDALLINVTGFFRDPNTWELLRASLLPRLLDTLGAGAPIRLWSAACATGEEAYSLAMLIHEAIGDEAFHRRVKVYATDIDEAALSVARAGRYSDRQLGALTDEQRATYFPGNTFRHDLRQAVIFGRHNLLSDAPISRISMLACRNALMYFTAETQAKVLERFSFALEEHGLLVLGRAEMLLTHGELFTPVDLPCRIFRARRRVPRPRAAATAAPAVSEDALRGLATAAFLGGPQAQLVLDADQTVLLVSDEAVRRLGVSREDTGRRFADLELSYRPVDLRSVVLEVHSSGRPRLLHDVRWTARGGHDHWWTVQVAPLSANGDGQGARGVQLTFADVTRTHALTEQLVTAHSELQSTYGQLQSSSEALETTNERLQSAIEELETTNEELQSTNEELETMNEELQSTNEELQTVNDELRDRTVEIGQVNALLEGILTGLQSAVVVVDSRGLVLAWNARAERLFGLRSYEAEGTQLSGLQGGVPLTLLAGIVDQVLSSGTPTPPRETAVPHRLGGELQVLLTGHPLRDGKGSVRGVVLSIDELAAEPGNR